MLGSPRDFSVARYSTVCETSPMPWDPGTPIDQRAAVTQQRLAALPANTFAPFDPPIVVEDEIDLCLRWPDVPRPPSTAAPLPYPTVPTLILQGGEDLRTPPEVSARIAARIPGLDPARRARHRALDDQRPADLRGRRDRNSSRGAAPPTSCKRIPTGIPAVVGAPASFSALKGYGGLPARVGRTVRALEATLDDLRLVLSPGRSRPPAADCAADRGGSTATSCACGATRPSRGVTVTGSGNSRLTLRVAGSKAARGTVTLRSGGRLTGTLGGRRISVHLGAPKVSSARASRALKLAR